MWAPREDKVHKGHWEERWWPTGLLTPQADICPAAPQARTTWHALVFGVDEKCIWDKSCLRKKTWGSGRPLPPQSSLCSLRNKLDCRNSIPEQYQWRYMGICPTQLCMLQGFYLPFKNIPMFRSIERDFNTSAILINSAWDLPRLFFFFNKSDSKSATTVEYSSFKNIICEETWYLYVIPFICRI